MRSLLSRSNDDPIKALFVALLVAMLCSLVVSSTSILLKPVHEANMAEQQRQVMQKMLARLPALEAIIKNSGANALETRHVDIASGKFLNSNELATKQSVTTDSDGQEE